MKRSAAKQINDSHFSLERINRSSLLALQGSLERLFFFVEVARLLYIMLAFFRAF